MLTVDHLCRPCWLYLAFHSKREEDLLSSLSDFGLSRGRKLGYMSVKMKTQRHLFLYEPMHTLEAGGQSGRGAALFCEGGGRAAAR